MVVWPEKVLIFTGMREVIVNIHSLVSASGQQGNTGKIKSPCGEVDRFLREELSSLHAISSPVRAVWPTYRIFSKASSVFRRKGRCPFANFWCLLWLAKVEIFSKGFVTSVS